MSEDDKIGINDINAVYGKDEDVMALYIENAYIDSLLIHIDIVEKIKEYYKKFENWFYDIWNRLLGIDPTADSITEKEVDID